MRIGIQSIYGALNVKNAIFDPATYKIGEQLDFPIRYLKGALEKRGHTLDTLDMHKLGSYKKVLFLDLPQRTLSTVREIKNCGIEPYLVLVESPLVYSRNWDRKHHGLFEKVFVWNDEWVDGSRYVHLKIAHSLGGAGFPTVKEKKKLCTMISANKTSWKKNNLYGERIKVIEWFERYHPDEFDLFGIGWDRGAIGGPRIVRVLNRFEPLMKVLGPSYAVYRGPVKSKLDTLANYRFAFAYENASGYAGYITEKLFDCFLSKSVPIYLGAPNITQYVPKECFIDRREFATLGDLYTYIKKMGDREYRDHQEAMQEFLSGGKSYPFSPQCLADTVISGLGL